MRTRVLRVGLLVVSLLAVGCRDEPPPMVPLAPAVTVAGVGCAEHLTAADLHDAEARFTAIGVVISAIRQQQCPSVGDEHRLCRALFLIGASDPLSGIAAGLENRHIDEMFEWYRWALDEGAVAADVLARDDVGRALRSLRHAGDGITAASGSVALADMAVERAAPAIIEPLAAAEQECLRTSAD